MVTPFGQLSLGDQQALSLAVGNELAVSTPLKSHHSSIFSGTWLVFPSLSNPFPCQNVPKRPRVKTSPNVPVSKRPRDKTSPNVPVSKRPQTSPIVSWLSRNACVDVLLHFYCLQACRDLGRDVEGLAGRMPAAMCVSL